MLILLLCPLFCLTGETTHGASTEFDVTKKDITPMGGFVQYGIVKEDYLMIKVGGCQRQ